LGRRETAEGSEATAPAEMAEPSSAEVLGMSLSELTDEVRSELELPPASKGLVITEVAEDSEAYEKGLRAGDVITEAGQQPIEAIDDLQTRIEETRDGGRKSLLLLIRRMGEPRFVALTVEQD
jgi:serine protease Do